ncbi:MAG: hypothetical protein WC378_05320 [Opitutaceae bacterium]|jgi:hypothetical protein
MTAAQRTRYFRDLWPAACAAQVWDARDEGRRRLVTADCMAAVKGPATASTTDLQADEVTALFCYLEFLGDPASLDKSARWLDCQQDYQAYNRARQADWHERAMYGHSKRPNKLDKHRFSGATSAAGGPLDAFDPEAIRKRHMTMASRHQKKERQAKKTAAKEPATPAPIPAPQRVEPPMIPATHAQDDRYPF